jgi:predicted TPR repeat methyltransferase
MRGGPPARGSIEEAIGRALHLAQAGRLEAADAAFREVLAKAPRHGHALHFRGMLLHRKGNTPLAIEHLERAVEALPEDVDARNNLANLYILAERLQEAEAALRAVVAAAPDYAPGRFNLGVLLRRTKRDEEAIAELRAAVKLAPDLDGYRELAQALQATSRFEAAVAALRRAWALGPRSEDLRKQLSRAYSLFVDHLDRSGAESALVLGHVDDWRKIDPDHPVALHTWASHGGVEAPRQCSPGYVTATFDEFADSFDEVLGKIGYVGVERSASALLAAMGPAGDPAAAVVADLGCGTGALAPLVRARCGRLIGIDLSPRMLEKARARELYDELVEADLTTWLAQRPSSADAMVCADTLIYVGDPAPFLRAAASALRPGGVLVLTAETLPADDPEPFRLRRRGRYAHRESHLALELRRVGLQVLAAEPIASLRIEFGEKVPAVLLTARRPDPGAPR